MPGKQTYWYKAQVAGLGPECDVCEICVQSEGGRGQGRERIPQRPREDLESVPVP